MLQKWYPNYTQVCTLAKPGGCLYTCVLGREWVLVLSMERELGLASAEGLGLAWE